MARASLRLLVSDLLATPGQSRREHLRAPVDLSFPNASVAAEAEIEATLASLTGGVVARGTATVEVDLVCNRCLVEWKERLDVPFEQVFRVHPDDEDEELPIEDGKWIDLGPLVHDEIALALPAAPLCRPDCRGLCPTCGTDLNTDPCDCHGDEPRSPFAELKQLFES